MISIYQLKSRFQKILRPISDFCARTGISANAVTVAAFVLSCAVGAAIYALAGQNSLWLWLLPVALPIRMALNAIDGMIARDNNQKTALGAILNELGDILSDCAMYVPFLYVLGVEEWLILIFTILTIVSETVGIMGVQIEASRRYDGPMGKSDRAFWLGLLAAISAHCVIPPKTIGILIGAICFLLIYTITNRVTGALREVKNK